MRLAAVFALSATVAVAAVYRRPAAMGASHPITPSARAEPHPHSAVIPAPLLAPAPDPTAPLRDGPLFSTVVNTVPPAIGYDIPGVGITEVDEFADEFADAAPGNEVAPGFSPPPDPVVDAHVGQLIAEGLGLLLRELRDAALARFERALVMRPSPDAVRAAIGRAGAEAIEALVRPDNEHIYMVLKRCLGAP